jgi:hypothetical protein
VTSPTTPTWFDRGLRQDIVLAHACLLAFGDDSVSCTSCLVLARDLRPELPERHDDLLGVPALTLAELEQLERWKLVRRVSRRSTERDPEQLGRDRAPTITLGDETVFNARQN